MISVLSVRLKQRRKKSLRQTLMIACRTCAGGRLRDYSLESVVRTETTVARLFHASRSDLRPKKNGATLCIARYKLSSRVCLSVRPSVTFVLCIETAEDTVRLQPASVAQWAETQCAPTGTVCRRSRGSVPGRPVDFVFGFQGRML